MLLLVECLRRERHHSYLTIALNAEGLARGDALLMLENFTSARGRPLIEEQTDDCHESSRGFCRKRTFWVACKPAGVWRR